jgi:hypothetical protein
MHFLKILVTTCLLFWVSILFWCSSNSIKKDHNNHIWLWVTIDWNYKWDIKNEFLEWQFETLKWAWERFFTGSAVDKSTLYLTMPFDFGTLIFTDLDLLRSASWYTFYKEFSSFNDVWVALKTNRIIPKNSFKEGSFAILSWSVDTNSWISSIFLIEESWDLNLSFYWSKQ